MKTRAMLEGAVLSAPYKQGGLDGLCGLYAAINAIAIVMAPVAPLSRAQAALLMAAGVNHLSRRKLLTAAVTDGMELGPQYKLTKLLATQASEMTDAPLTVSRPAMHMKPFTRRALLEVLDSGLDQGAALIVSLEHRLDHYTVIAGRSEKRYHLCDSGRLHWIKRESIGPSSARAGRTHQVKRRGIVQVSVAP